MGAAQAVNVGVMMLSVIVLSRLLMPHDFGIIAMTTPITGFVLLFQGLGLNQAAIQAKTLSGEQRNALFQYNVLASGVMVVLLFALAPLVAWFYDDVRPGYIVAASTLNVVLGGLAMQHMAHLNREMRFADLAKIQVVGSIASFLVTCGAALYLGNYWALWIGMFAASLWNCAALWIADDWRPSLRNDLARATDLFRFGLDVTWANLLSFLVRNVDDVLIAKVWGTTSLGLYDRAYRLMMFPLQQINAPLSRIFLPLLARLSDEPARYRRVYLMAIRAISMAVVPGAVAAAMTAHALIPFLLGERWTGAAPIFFWLALAVAMQPVTATNSWLFLTTNRSREMLRWTMIGAPFTIACFVVGLQYGAAGVAAAYFVAETIKTPVLIYKYTRTTPVSAGDVYHALVPSLLGGGLGWLAVLLLEFERLAAPLFIGAAVLLSYACAFACHLALERGRQDMRDGIAQLRAAIGKEQ